MELLIIPAVGSGVIVGSLTGGFEQLVTYPSIEQTKSSSTEGIVGDLCWCTS